MAARRSLEAWSSCSDCNCRDPRRLNRNARSWGLGRGMRGSELTDRLRLRATLVESVAAQSQPRLAEGLRTRENAWELVRPQFIARRRAQTPSVHGPSCRVLTFWLQLGDGHGSLACLAMADDPRQRRRMPGQIEADG